METIPKSESIIGRIRSCRDELAALKKLLRLSQAVEQANVARQSRNSERRQRRGVNHAR